MVLAWKFPKIKFFTMVMHNSEQLQSLLFFYWATVVFIMNSTHWSSFWLPGARAVAYDCICEFCLVRLCSEWPEKLWTVVLTGATLYQLPSPHHSLVPMRRQLWCGSPVLCDRSLLLPLRLLPTLLLPAMNLNGLGTSRSSRITLSQKSGSVTLR